MDILDKGCCRWRSRRGRKREEFKKIHVVKEHMGTVCGTAEGGGDRLRVMSTINCADF